MSSDPTDKRPAAPERRGEDAETLDQSLDEIMKEVQQAEAAAAQPPESVTAEIRLPIPAEAVRPPDDRQLSADAPPAAAEESAPAADVRTTAEVAIAQIMESADADQAPVEPAEPAMAAEATTAPASEVVTSAATEIAEPAAEAPAPAAPSAESRSSENAFDELSFDDVEAEVVVESLMASGSGEINVESLGIAPPRTPEEVLDKVVVPPAGSELAPSPTELFSRPDGSLPRLDFDDERTVISPAPEPEPTRPAPALATPEKPRRVTPTWPGTETVNPTASARPIGRLPRPPASPWSRVREVANHRVNASVAQLAIMVVSAIAFGAAAVRVMTPAAPIAAIEPTLAPERPPQPHFESLPPRPPEIAPLPSTVAEEPAPAPAVEVEKPKPRPKVRARPRPAPVAPTAEAEVPPEKPVEAAPAAAERPATSGKKPPAKPHTRHVAQQGTTWVDPFGD
jgi:hypothetical protein